MYANWPTGKINKDTSTEQVENIISIISEIRSFKNELKCKPWFIYRYVYKQYNENPKSFINENEIILKKLGRINNILSSDLDKPAATMVSQVTYLRFILIKMLI